MPGYALPDYGLRSDDEDDDDKPVMPTYDLRDYGPDDAPAPGTGPEPVTPERSWYEHLAGSAAAVAQGASADWIDEFAESAGMEGTAEYLRGAAREYPWAHGAGQAGTATVIGVATAPFGPAAMLGAEGLFATTAELGQSHDWARAGTSGVLAAETAGIGGAVLPALARGGKRLLGETAEYLGLRAPKPAPLPARAGIPEPPRPREFPEDAYEPIDLVDPLEERIARGSLTEAEQAAAPVMGINANAPRRGGATVHADVTPEPFDPLVRGRLTEAQQSGMPELDINANAPYRGGSAVHADAMPEPPVAPDPYTRGRLTAEEQAAAPMRGIDANAPYRGGSTVHADVTPEPPDPFTRGRLTAEEQAAAPLRDVNANAPYRGGSAVHADAFDEFISMPPREAWAPQREADPTYGRARELTKLPPDALVDPRQMRDLKVGRGGWTKKLPELEKVSPNLRPTPEPAGPPPAPSDAIPERVRRSDIMEEPIELPYEPPPETMPEPLRRSDILEEPIELPPEPPPLPREVPPEPVRRSDILQEPIELAPEPPPMPRPPAPPRPSVIEEELLTNPNDVHGMRGITPPPPPKEALSYRPPQTPSSPATEPEGPGFMSRALDWGLNKGSQAGGVTGVASSIARDMRAAGRRVPAALPDGTPTPPYVSEKAAKALGFGVGTAAAGVVDKVAHGDKYAYAGKASLHFAIRDAMQSPRVGLTPNDQKTMSQAIVSGDDAKIREADFLLRQRYPTYARLVEQALRKQQEED